MSGAQELPAPLLRPYGTAAPSSIGRWRCVTIALTASIVIAVTTIVIASVESHSSSSPASTSSACAPVSQLVLVQSTPVGDFDIPPNSKSLATHEAFVQLADASVTSLDFTAMYMDLLGVQDHQQFNATQMQGFGAARGVAVFEALERAAQRGVQMRILLGTLNDPINSTEVRTLLSYSSVSARTWDPRKWYDGGIMHLKLWHSDGQAAYIGSANTDWKSLAQVKEIGVLLNGSLATADFGRVFEVFWQWAAPGVPGAQVQTYSERFQAELTLPPWDIFVPVATRSLEAAPFDLAATSPLAAVSNATRPQLLCAPADGSDAPAAAFVSASPGGAVAADRTFDEDALLETIASAAANLSMNVMDFLPASAYSGGHGSGSVYWPTLVDAAIAVAFAKPVRVRVLFSHWAHTDPRMVPAMQRLADGLVACSGNYNTCAGTLEVRQFEVPGWQNTTPPNALWPEHTRVNHAKYIVTDSRLNIGTSNWEWGYMFQTAGASWNTNSSEMVAVAQQVFDRDWASSYAVPLP